ncbi:MAG: AAA family ATPase, partial [archaeon]|nr:AAA family ATPase [archaeon]
MSQQYISLKVLEAYTRDVGRGVARIDYDTMDALGASTGDIVEVRGKRRTVAKCLPLYPSDEGRGVIRVDGLIRNNSGVAIGDTVIIKKIKALPAEKVVVAPLEAIPPIDERYLADALESVPVTKGDNVMIPYFGGRLTFQIVGINPMADAVLITQRTIFVISEKGEIFRGVPQVTYEDIGGLKDEIQKVREMIELPLRHPEIFEKLGVEAPKGVLLYGPPGTGKTLLAKAVATESNAHFISISGPEIMSKFYGESEARLREIFKEAKEKSPSIVFIDEIDSIAPKREEVTGEVERRVVSQLLSLMDGLEARGKVIVIAATNRPNALDPALRRPGRFDREIEIKVPDKKGRLEILQIHTRNMPLTNDVNLEKLASVTHGFVGADLEYLCKEAAMKALRRVLPELKLGEDKLQPDVLNKLQVNAGDFENALKDIMPSAMREVYLETPDVKWNDI